MNSEPCDIVNSILIISVAAFNYFFLYMWHILRGKWYSISPTWEWIKDIRELKKLSVTAESDELRTKCKFVLNGIYFSSGLLLIGILLGFIK
jgi:hypothetical protein